MKCKNLILLDLLGEEDYEIMLFSNTCDIKNDDNFLLMFLVILQRYKTV